ncbi:MAG TPA: hypothetical protein VK386_04630 [Acidimicrobiales bacterium]|nr:hypothetical protein [Acidimicrobiales bacterium]
MANSIEPRKKGGLSVLDTALIGAGVVGGVLVLLWIFSAVAHVVLLVFKVAILVILVALVVRLVHLFTRGRR